MLQTKSANHWMLGCKRVDWPNGLVMAMSGRCTCGSRTSVSHFSISMIVAAALNGSTWRPAGQEDGKDLGLGLFRSSDRGRALQDPHRVLTDNGIQVRLPPRCADGQTASYVTHKFDMRFQETAIEDRLTKVKHPWTNAQVERMNRTIKGRGRPTLPLRSTRSARNSSCRLHHRRQPRPTAEDPEGPHTLRIHLQMDFPARTIQARPAPANAGTKHLGPTKMAQS
ncbi:hypothetical protein ACVWWK_003163 [Bradyrhizobium sp. LB9.1b]